jgi:hypothetical protein
MEENKMKAKKIENFDLATAKSITPKLKAALDTVSKELGITVELTCKLYDKMYAQFNLIVNVDDGMTIAERAFNSAALSRQITEKVGDIVLSRGVEFRIAGWKDSARRFPILATRLLDGQAFGLPMDVLPSQAARIKAGEDMAAAWEAKMAAARAAAAN